MFSSVATDFGPSTNNPKSIASKLGISVQFLVFEVDFKIIHQQVEING